MGGRPGLLYYMSIEAISFDLVEFKVLDIGPFIEGGVTSPLIPVAGGVATEVSCMTIIGDSR